MAISRYKNSEIFKNVDADYKKVFSTRFGPEGLVQRKSLSLRSPSSEEIKSIDFFSTTWGLGKRLYKLSYEHYSDSQYWWVIALFNNIATEAEIELGNEIKIPVPLDRVLSLYGF
jgi:nucleoid-associated protein YgaU